MDYPGTELKEGSTGPAVLEVQKALGFGPGGQTGTLGPTTEEALVKFQRDNRLDADGVVGPKTWAKLFAPRTLVTSHGGLGSLALKYALSEQKAGVREVPRGSNRGPKVDVYLRLAGLAESEIRAGRGYWCAAFVNWCTAQAAQELGIANPIPAGAKFNCNTLYSWAKSSGRLVTQPQAADVFLCIQGMKHYHTGFVAGPVGANAHYPTVEGNSNTDGSANGYEVAYRANGRGLASCHYVRL